MHWADMASIASLTNAKPLDFKNLKFEANSIIIIILKTHLYFRKNLLNKILS